MAIDLTAGIVRILGPDGTTSGTGFVVTEGGLIATCSHVIQSQDSQLRGEKRPNKVKVVFQATGEEREARVQPGWWRAASEEDVAILKLDGDLPPEIQALPLGSSGGAGGHKFKTYGFPDARSENGLWGYGVIGDLLPDGAGCFWLQLTGATEISFGFSGAPVLDKQKRRIVGMVTAIATPEKSGRLVQTAFITPIEILQAVCPDLQLSDICPYMGLSSFKEEDAEFFFGRKQELDRLVERLKGDPRFLAVFGPSGSGKSSIIQAGLIPALRSGAVPGSDRWGIIPPVRPGDNPLENLEASGLQGASKGIEKAATVWLNENPGKSRMVLILDQFEELFAIASPEVRKDFLSQLTGLLGSDLPITLILVIRDEFWHKLMNESPTGFSEWLNAYEYISSDLRESELAEIIDGPARHVGLHFEEGLVEAITKDVLEKTASGERVGRSTILPLLEFALTQLCDRQNEGYLTHEAYKSIGGVTGSLIQWADQAYQILANEGLGDTTRRILMNLVNPGDKQQNLPDSRRRRSLHDVSPKDCCSEDVARIVHHLVDIRLVATSFDEKSGRETIEIIHDSLIREWDRLQQWLDEDRSFRTWKKEMEGKAAAWEEGGRDEGRMIHGTRDLGRAESWLEDRSSDIGEREHEYIRYSLERGKREENTRRRRIKVFEALFAILLLVSVIAVFQYHQTNESREEALALYLASQSMQIDIASASDHMRQLMLAVESLHHKKTAEGDFALRSSIALMVRPLAQLDHNSSVNAVAFSPDGTKVLTGGGDSSARLWDISSGQEILRLAHNSSVNAVAFSPDGTKALTGGDDDTARLWDASSGQEFHKLVHNGSVNAVAFSPNGTRVMTGSDDGTARIWDISSGQEIQKLSHERKVFSVAFSPNGTMIATGGSDGTARIWNVSSGQELHNLVHDDDVFSVAFSPDGTSVVTGSSDGMARIWHVLSGHAIDNFSQDGSVYSVAFSPDGTKIITGSFDNMARVWDVSGGQVVHKLYHDGPVHSIAFSPDGNQIITGSGDRTAQIWNISSGHAVHKLPHHNPVDSFVISPDGSYEIEGEANYETGLWKTLSGQGVYEPPFSNLVYSVAFSPDGTLAVTGSDDFTARVWDVSSGHAVHELRHFDPVFAVAFSPDGTYLVTGSGGDNTRIWNVSRGQEVHTLDHEGKVYVKVYCVAFSPDGTKVVTGSFDNTARIWDVSSGQSIHTLAHGDRVYSVAFSPDGTKVVTASGDNTARIWDVSSGRLVHPLAHGDRVYSVAFSPDGDRVVTGSFDNTARIWDVSSGRLVHSLAHGDRVYSVAFSPDGTKVVSASGDNTARIWDVSSGQSVHTLGHDGPVYSLAFGPDGTKIITGSYDGMARIWDVSSGQVVHSFAHEGEVHVVAFSPDGSKVLTGGGDGAAWIWPVSYEDLIDQACDCISENLTIEDWEKYKIGNVRTCPREGSFNHSISTRLLTDPVGLLTGEPDCQPCIAEAFRNRK